MCLLFGRYYVGFSTGIFNYVITLSRLFFYVCKSDYLATQSQPLLQTSLSTILLHEQKPSHFEESVMSTAVLILMMCFLRFKFSFKKLPKKKPTPDIYLINVQIPDT
jgi:hypothetical protein